MDFDTTKRLTDDNLMPTYAHFDAAIVSGHGATVTDTQGKMYIDFTSGIGVNALGYGDAGWLRAITEQAAQLQHISNLYYNPTVARLAATLTERTGFDRVFLCNSGAEANECAVKLARKYSFDTHGKGRATIVSLVNSFHGRTLATLTATGQETFHNYFFPFVEGFRYAQANDLDSLTACLDDSVCAVMLEPIQGEGGVQPLDADYIRAVAQLCRERDLLLIFDEVQTGVGRTGKLYAWEYDGVRPDILTSAKGLGNGLPVGACLCVEKLGAVLSAGTHGTTFGGNPVVCAGALEVLKRLDEPFLDEVRRKGAYLKSRIEQMKRVEAVRGRGMMLGVALKEGDAKALAAQCVENGLLILTAKTLLRLLPPLVITDEEMETGLERLARVLD